MGAALNPKNVDIANQWLFMMSTEFGFPRVMLDKDGCCGFTIDHGPTILMYLVSNRVVLSTYLVKKNAVVDVPSVLERFFEWNYLDLNPLGVSIGFCPSTASYTLTASLEFDALDSIYLYNALQNFNNSAKIVVDRILEINKQDVGKSIQHGESNGLYLKP